MIDTPRAAVDQQGDPYRWGVFTNAPRQEYPSTPYYDLLNKKIAEAEASLKAELHSQLWGRKPESTPLRQAIADAYDQVTHEAAISSTLSAYKDQISKQIFSESPILKGLASLTKQEKEKDMTDSNTIARAAVDKRKEKRAKERAEWIGDILDDNHWQDGDTIAWSVKFKTNADKTYHYVAVRGGPSWYITGDTCRYGNDELTTKIVGLSLDGKVEIPEWEIDL